MKSQIIPIEVCIDYVRECGFKYVGNWGKRYFFEKIDGNMPNGGKDVAFSLAEIRHAKKFGW